LRILSWGSVTHEPLSGVVTGWSSSNARKCQQGAGRVATCWHVAVKTNHQPRLRTNGDGHPHIAYKTQWPTGPVIFTDQSPAHPLLLRYLVVLDLGWPSAKLHVKANHHPPLGPRKVLPVIHLKKTLDKSCNSSREFHVNSIAAEIFDSRGTRRINTRRS